MQTREWILTAAVIVVPLIIAVAVTLWSLDQVRYRPKQRRSTATVARETSAGFEPSAPGAEDAHPRLESAASGGHPAVGRGESEWDAGSRR